MPANQQKTTTSNSSQEMVDCSSAPDPWCFVNRMNVRLPVTTKMQGNDGTNIEITIL